MPERKRGFARRVGVVSSRQWRVDVLRTEQVHPVGIRVGDRESGARRQLALECQSRLHDIRGTQAGTHFFGGLVAQRCKCGRRGDSRIEKEIRIADHVLLLNNSFVAFCGADVRKGEAIVKKAEAGASPGFGTGIAGPPPGGPGNRYAWGKIAPVVDVALGFISKPETHSYIRTSLPLIASKH